METSRILEGPSEALVPFVIEGTTKLAQIGQQSLVKNALANIGIDFLSFVSGNLTEYDRRRIDAHFFDWAFYNPVKGFGPISLIEETAAFDFSDPKNNIKLVKGEPYLAIHLGDGPGLKDIFPIFKKREEEEPITKNSISKSLIDTAKYVKFNRKKIPGNFVIGMTYNKLAHAAKRYGFSLSETPLPEEQNRKSTRVFKLLEAKYGIKADNLSLCFQSYDDLIKRFAPPTQPL